MRNIKVGQKYKTFGGEQAVVKAISTNPKFPVEVRIGARPFSNLLTLDGRNEIGYRMDDDLAKLIP